MSESSKVRRRIFTSIRQQCAMSVLDDELAERLQARAAQQMQDAAVLEAVERTSEDSDSTETIGRESE